MIFISISVNVFYNIDDYISGFINNYELFACLQLIYIFYKLKQCVSIISWRVFMKRYVIFIMILISAVQLFADQAAWITKDQAEKGAALIRTSGEIRHFCAPCGDNFYRAETVSTSVAVKAQGSDPKDSFFEVLVNGSGIDLAYVYILSGGKWTNVAMLLNIHVEGVSKILPADLHSEEVTAEELPSEENVEDYDGSADMPFEEGK